MLKTGLPAPDFTGTLEDGSTFTLSDWLGLKHVVLYFYLKDFTKGWTIESIGFRDVHEAIVAQDGLIVGISANSVESHLRFRDSLGLPYHLLSDSDKHIIRLYDVNRRLPLLPNKRVTYIVSKDGLISVVYHHELAFGQHKNDVLDGLRALNGRWTALAAFETHRF
jgi:peroxiredoxin Q/BCP